MKNKQWFRQAFAANFTLRRVFALLIGWGCIASGLLVVMGVVKLELILTITIWIAGLFFLEWAG